MSIKRSLRAILLFFHRNNLHFSLRNAISEKILIPLAVILFFKDYM